MYSRFFDVSFFDDILDLGVAAAREVDDAGRSLLGRCTARIMKTDIREFDDRYEFEIDLPGFKKEDLALELEDGVLTVRATKEIGEDETGENGRLIRRERYVGAMQRSFNVGEYVTEEDVKARFEDGVLRLSVPRKDAPKAPEKKSIIIEG